jgi:hypothetical protein
LAADKTFVRKLVILLAFIAVAGCSSSNSNKHDASRQILPLAVPLADRKVQADLLNGMTTEKTVYGDTHHFTTSRAELTGVESSLDWGGTLQVTVSPDSRVVCLDERSQLGSNFAVARIADGAGAGTYFDQTDADPANQRKLCFDGAGASYYSQWKKSWSS